MNLTGRTLGLSGLLLAGMTSLSPAAPIRVGLFRGTGAGSGNYWHTNTHTASSVMASLLANPAGAGLGDSLVIPRDGFTFYAMPVAPNYNNTAECAQNGCGPTPEQVAAIVASLDTLDVLIMNSIMDLGSRIPDTSHRRTFEAFWNTKGTVSIHVTADYRNRWAQSDSVHGAISRGWTAEQMGTVRRDSAFSDEPGWRFLNRGLFSNGTDTTLLEEWLYFTTSGTDIRSRTHLKPTINFVEASIISAGSQAPMGDHPMSWYRERPGGGRFFYTGLGHRAQAWQNTRMLRRQLYNAILWAAGVDSNGVVSVRGRASQNVSRFSDVARIEPNRTGFVVSLMQDGSHSVELLKLNGERIEMRRGEGRADHRFEALRQGVYAVSVAAGGRRTSRLVTVP